MWTIALWSWGGYAGALALVLMARGARVLVERRGGTVRIVYPDGRAVRIPKGLSVLDASRRAGIPHASVCGGRARCSTCRVRVLLGLESLPPPSPVETRVLAPLRADRAVRLACQLKPVADISIWPLMPPGATVGDQDRLNVAETGAERFVAILFVDIRASTQLVENRLPYDVVFILNRFFEAVGSAITAAGGAPNQFIGDGMMAMFGTKTDAAEACRQALEAARLIDWHLAEMNRALANELQEPIEVGIGIHGGEVIIGTMGYREHAQMTAIGEAVHVASRLQDLTKEYGCQLVVSETVAATGGDIRLAISPAIRSRCAVCVRRWRSGWSTAPRRWPPMGQRPRITSYQSTPSTSLQKLSYDTCLFRRPRESGCQEIPLVTRRSRLSSFPRKREPSDFSHLPLAWQGGKRSYVSSS